jgi:hypothetical protein
MGYSKKDWHARIRERTDMSTLLTHLTRESQNGKAAQEVLLNILIEKRLIGSTNAQGFICGDTPAVCFQDAPIYSIAQNTLFEQKMREDSKSSVIRYRPLGVAFSKPYLYMKGARPVVYDNTETAKEFLPRDEWWRIVRLDLSNDNAFVDWTHEREWRLPGNLEFDLSEVTLLSVDNKAVTNIAMLYRTATGRELRDEIGGIVTLRDVLY